MRPQLNGWIKIHRKMVDWEWYDDTNTVRVFVHILLTASFRDTRWHGIKIKRGQLLTSIGHMADELKMTRQEVRTALNHLKLTNELTIKSTNRYTLITVEKYSDFQDVPDDINQQTNQPVNQQPTNSQPTGNQQVTNSQPHRKKDKKDKNYKKDKKIYTTASAEDVSKVLEYFYDVTGIHVPDSDPDVDLIRDRLEEGYSEKDCRRVIAKKRNEWGDDKKMQKYLRIKTLFAEDHFSEYLKQNLPYYLQDDYD